MLNIAYIAINNEELFPGVHRKIKQTVTAFNGKETKAEHFIIDPSHKFKSIVEYFKVVSLCNADIIILRNSILTPILFFPMLRQRLLRRKIIIDVPTPLNVILTEINFRRTCWLSKIARKIIILILFPLAFWPANKIIQYAPESRYFSFGVKRKIQLTANGIDVSQVKVRQTIPSWPCNTLVMIGVGSLAEWHGFDRVIKSMADYLNKYENPSIKPTFIIVGDGDARQDLERLARDLGLKEYVKFVGYKTGSELDVFFDKAHIAVASLGLYRKNLEMASDLKSREYAARGMPFLKSGYDFDFDPAPNFVFEVENNANPISLEDLIEWYNEMSQEATNFAKIRNFAEDNLDFTVKVGKVLSSDVTS